MHIGQIGFQILQGRQEKNNITEPGHPNCENLHGTMRRLARSVAGTARAAYSDNQSRYCRLFGRVFEFSVATNVRKSNTCSASETRSVNCRCTSISDCMN